MARRRKRKRRISAVRADYMRQRRRFYGFVNTARKHGYDVTVESLIGKIPERVTKKQVAKLSQITTWLQAIDNAIEKVKKKETPELSATLQQAVAETEKQVFTRADIVIYNFELDLEAYHPEVQKTLQQFEELLIMIKGKEGFADVIDTAKEEGYLLSPYGGYLIPPEELELYLNRLGHLAGVTGIEEYQTLMNTLSALIGEYESYVDSAEAREWGSWHTR